MEIKSALAKVRWVDAVTYSCIALQDALKQGIAIKESVGWVEGVKRSRRRKVLVLRSEKSEPDDGTGDYTLIPYSWVEEIVYLDI